MSTTKQICDLLTDMIAGKSSMSEVCNAIMDIILHAEESSHQVGYSEGKHFGYERGYEEGRRDTMRNVENNVMGYNSLSGYDRERLMRIVRTGSPY